MILTERQMQVVDVILKGLAVRCCAEPLATLQEGFVKVVVVRLLLDAGYVVAEGANRKGEVWLLRNDGQKIVTQRLPGQQPRGDVRVVDPSLAIELKVRPAAGSLALARSKQFIKDMKLVGGGSADVFLLAADRGGYDAMRGKKANNRGRKAACSFSDLLPPSRNLNGEPRPFNGTFQGVQFHLQGLIVEASVGDEKVLVAAFR